MLKFSKVVFVVLCSVVFFGGFPLGAEAVDLSGDWIEKSTGGKCVIKQNGETLLFSNYAGEAPGQITGPTSLSTNGWGGGSGTISDGGNTITWSNGYIWNRQGAVQTGDQPVVPPSVQHTTQPSNQKPNLNGNWVEKETGGNCVIKQSGDTLLFSNYAGEAAGQVTGPTSLTATNWGGGSATITNGGNTINWSNGYTWNRK